MNEDEMTPLDQMPIVQAVVPVRASWSHRDTCKNLTEGQRLEILMYLQQGFDDKKGKLKVGMIGKC